MSIGFRHRSILGSLLRALLLLLLPAAQALAAPRLIVIIVADQFRAEFLERSYAAGLKRLAQEGAYFTEAHHQHLPTETAPGHAAISTGRLPGEHGIVGNEWWDRSRTAPTTSVGDPLFGASPRLLEAYTLGDAMKARDPLSKVVAVSVKDRSAILLGGKRADAAVWYDRRQGRFVTSNYYGPPPAWLDAFNAKLRGPGEPLAGATTEQAKNIIMTPAADRMVLELASQALERFELGTDEHTDLLAVSFSATDYVGHFLGPEGPEMKAQLESLDKLIGALVDRASAKTAGAVDVAFTADHGSSAASKMRAIAWTRFHEDLEKRLQQLHPAPAGHWIVYDAPPNLHLNRPLAEQYKVDWSSFTRETAALLRNCDGFDQAYVPEELAAATTAAVMLRASYYPGRSGDVLYVLKPRIFFHNEDEVYLGIHGSPYEYDTHVPLVFWGPDFKRGRVARPVPVISLAPTLLRLLGLDPGRLGLSALPLAEAFK